MFGKNNFQKITAADAFDKTFIPFIPQKDQIYFLQHTLVVDLKAVAAALIIPDATNIHLEEIAGWVSIFFNYDHALYYIAFKSKLGEYVEFKTNCSAYLLQDVLHSLYKLPKDSRLTKNILTKIIKSLSTTPYAIRELGVEDKQYRTELRGIVESGRDNINELLIERRQQYRSLAFVREQMKLTQMVLNPLTDDDVYLSGMDNMAYLDSFPADQKESYYKKHKPKIDFSADIDVEASTKEYFMRVAEAVGFLSDAKFLDVGFGLGKAFFLMAKAFPTVRLYGIEPNAVVFNVFMGVLGRTAYSGLQQENFFPEKVQDFAKRKEHLGTFDVIMISAFDVPVLEREKVLEAASALCKPDGKLVITCLNSDYADPLNKAADKNRMDTRNSILPFLFNHFGEVARGPYLESCQVHRFLFVCTKPKRKVNFTPLPHVALYGAIQRYKIPQWNKEFETLIQELGGSFQYCDQSRTSAYVWVASGKMKNKANGGYRETFGLDRLRLVGRNELEDAANKIKLLVTMYPDITVEADLEQPNSYLITFPNHLRPRVEYLINKDPKKFEKDIIKSQAFMRGFIVRQQFKKEKKIVDDLRQQCATAASKGDDRELLKLSSQLGETRKSFMRK